MLLTLRAAHAATLGQLIENQVIPLPFAIDAHPFHLFWHDAADADPGNAWLRAIIVEVMGRSSGHEAGS